MPKTVGILCVMCIALAVMNIATFIIFGADKLKAIRGSYRISEKALLSWCAAFGALGGLLGMFCFHHKTKKPKFLIAVPTLLIVQAAIIATVIFLAL